MGKCKEHPKYNVLSIRITDEEKAFMDAMKRSTRKSMSMLLREAMNQYTPQLKGACKQGN
jgi:predicted transcriptional regulator